jgi:hypothetical protein
MSANSPSSSEGSGSASAVSGVLAQMDRHTRMVKLAVVGAVGVEGLLMIIVILNLDWSNTTHLLIFVFAVLGYTIIVLGLAALGAHVSRVGLRIVAALDASQR